MQTVLVTGFEPFGGAAANPSADAVRALAASWGRPERLVTAILPVTFRGAADELARLLAAHSPDVVIAVGLAGGRAEIAVERVAVNLIDARIPDNDGAQPIDVESIPGGSAARFASLPVKRIVAAIAAAGVPAVASLSAGTFVCNHVFLHAAAWAAATAGARTGFIHVPWADGQDPSAPTLPAAEIATAIRIAVEMSLDRSDDLAVTAGRLH